MLTALLSVAAVSAACWVLRWEPVWQHYVWLLLASPGWMDALDATLCMFFSHVKTEIRHVDVVSGDRLYQRDILHTHVERACQSGQKAVGQIRREPSTAGNNVAAADLCVASLQCLVLMMCTRKRNWKHATCWVRSANCRQGNWKAAICTVDGWLFGKNNLREPDPLYNLHFFHYKKGISGPLSGKTFYFRHKTMFSVFWASGNTDSDGRTEWRSDKS